MYKNPVQPATIFLDGQRARFLVTHCHMKAAEKLRALREGLPGEIGVRAIAAELGFEMPNSYGYYESAQFTKALLPLDKARLFAPAFEKFGGRGRDVLELAGLVGSDLDSEASAVKVPVDQIATVQLPVALPSEAVLTAMMSGLLRSVGLNDQAVEHSGTLARLLPAALAQAAAGTIHRPISSATKSATRPRPRAKRDPGQER